jgi:hypothetical protein
VAEINHKDTKNAKQDGQSCLVTGRVEICVHQRPGFSPGFRASLVRWLRSLVCLALFAGTNLAQIGEGIDAGCVTIIPVELDRVMTDLGSSRNLDRTFSKHWERIRLNLYLWRLIPAGGAGTILAEIGVRIGGLMAIVPGDGDSAGGGELYRSRDKIHRGGSLLNRDSGKGSMVGNADLGRNSAGDLSKGFGIGVVILIQSHWLSLVTAIANQ